MDNDLKTYTTAEAVKSNKKWFLTWKIIYPVLGIVVIVELALGVKTLLAPLPKPKPIQQVQPVADGRIILAGAKKSFNVGSNIPVRVNVFTGGHTTSGSDVIMRFNPKALEAVSFTKGKIYNDYPLINMDNKAGLIRVSGIAPAGKKGFAGGGDLGIVNFKAKQAGQTSVTVDFKKGATYDSNVMGIVDSQDILGSVTNLNLTIK